MREFISGDNDRLRVCIDKVAQKIREDLIIAPVSCNCFLSPRATAETIVGSFFSAPRGAPPSANTSQLYQFICDCFCNLPSDQQCWSNVTSAARSSREPVLAELRTRLRHTTAGSHFHQNCKPGCMHASLSNQLLQNASIILFMVCLSDPSEPSADLFCTSTRSAGLFRLASCFSSKQHLDASWSRVRRYSRKLGLRHC